MNIKRLVIILLIVVALGFLFRQQFVYEPVSEFLNQDIPWSIPLVAYITVNISSGTLVGLLLYLAFVNIPILPSPPAEAYLLFAVSKGTNVIGVLLAAVLVYIIFSSIYYFIGRYFGQRLLEKLLKRSIGHIPILERFIVPITFFAFLLPIPIPIPLGTILILLSGYYKVPYVRVIAAVGTGLLLRFVGILILYNFYTPLIGYYLSNIDKLFKIG